MDPIAAFIQAAKEAEKVDEPARKALDFLKEQNKDPSAIHFLGFYINTISVREMADFARQLEKTGRCFYEEYNPYERRFIRKEVTLQELERKTEMIMEYLIFVNAFATQNGDSDKPEWVELFESLDLIRRK